MVPSTDVFQDLTPDDVQAAEQGFYVAAADGQQMFFPYAGIGDKGDNGHTYDGWYAYWGESPAQSGKSDSICHGTLAFSCHFACICLAVSKTMEIHADNNGYACR